MLSLTFAWSLIFFAPHLTEIALLDIVILWIAIKVARNGVVVSYPRLGS